MADPILIIPRDLPPATEVFASDALVVDDGTIVAKATPQLIVNAGAPVASQAEAIAGVDNTKRMTPLRTKQVLDNVTAPSVLRAQAWAESATNPDPAYPDSKSSKSWASVAFDNADRAEAAAATSEEWAWKNISDFPFDSVAAVLSSEQLTGDLGNKVIYAKTGECWHIPEDQSITNWHVQTAGGAKMYVVEVNGAYPLTAFGEVSGQDVDATPVIQKAVLSVKNRKIVFPQADVRMGSTVNLDGTGVTLDMAGCTLRPIANDFTIFKATEEAYGVKIYNMKVRGSGTTGVQVFDMHRWVRNGACLVRPDIADVGDAIFLNELCYGLIIDCPTIYNCERGITVYGAAGAVHILHPMIEMTGTGSGGIGIDISNSPSYASVGTRIDNGAIERGNIGIRDRGVNTQIIGTYFERLSEADVFFDTGSRFAYAEATNHTSSIGAVAFKGRGADGVRIFHPFMSSSGRSTGLFDFDASNTNCYQDVMSGASSINTPRGITTGILPSTAKPGPIGSVTPNTGAFTTLSSSDDAVLATARSGLWTASIEPSTGTTFLTLSTGVHRGRYEIYAEVAFSGNAGQYTAFATVLWDGNKGRFVTNDGTVLKITFDGDTGQVKVIHTAGSARTIHVSWLKIGP